ncbi:MAG: hypothetical protein ACRDBG_09915 [Waterburya sp.]
MEFTKVELIYIFNCISDHGGRVDSKLQEFREKIIQRPSRFFKLASDIEAILNDLITGYEIQLGILPEIELGDDEGIVEKDIQKGLKAAIGYKFDLSEIFGILDEDEDE